MSFFRKNVEGTNISEMAPKRVCCNFLGINTNNFVKIYPKLENKSLFDATFYGA